MILRNKNGLCHNIGLALCYLDIILKSIIWADAPMVDRISSLSQDRLHVSGRVRGAERGLMLCPCWARAGAAFCANTQWSSLCQRGGGSPVFPPE